MTPAQKLRHLAADLIEKFGWVQGRYGNVDCGFCIVGACFQASMQSTDPRIPVTTFEDIYNYLNLTWNTDGQDLAEWNDTPGRTVEEVLTALRAA